MTTFSRSLADAAPTLAERVLLLQEEFARDRAPQLLVVTCVWRSPLVQQALYAQGRLPAPAVNLKRAAAGLPPLSAEEAARTVTWTRASKHLLLASRAVDLAVAVDPDGPAGPLKPVIDWKDEPAYRRMGALAERLGLVWGGRWHRPDLCHVELP